MSRPITLWAAPSTKLDKNQDTLIEQSFAVQYCDELVLTALLEYINLWAWFLMLTIGYFSSYRTDITISGQRNIWEYIALGIKGEQEKNCQKE